jgi:hypothetical protein
MGTNEYAKTITSSDRKKSAESEIFLIMGGSGNTQQMD